MTPSEKMKRLTIDNPAKYKIDVQGFLEEVWADRLAGMKMTMNIPGDKGPVTTLVGQVRDQAELIGVLNGLYELRMPILSLELIDTE